MSPRISCGWPAGALAFLGILVLGMTSALAAPDGQWDTKEFPHHVIVIDFNGDGLSDLAVCNAGGRMLTVLLGNGSGGFKSNHNYPTGTARPILLRCSRWRSAS
jgi:hypothetical protein